MNVKTIIKKAEKI